MFMFKRKKFVALIAAILTLSSTNVLASTSIEEADKPNIIFIFADDFGWGDISKHGHPDIRTPNIDRLADEGSEFYQFSVSNPVCSPSRAGVLTGQYPARHSVNRHFASQSHHVNMSMGDWLDPSVVTMPRLIRDAGYKTAHFGKWHLGLRSDAPLPAEYGYDETAVFNGNGPQTTFTKMFDDTVDFIKRNKDVPFFINLWIHETHLPHVPSDKSMEKYKHLDKQHQVYAATVDGADERIGKVLNVLDELGLAENTLVVFSSDNGPEHTGTKKQMIHGGKKIASAEKKSGKQGVIPYGKYYSVGKTGGLRGQKRDTYEGGLRVPFIVRWPAKVPAGRADTQSIVSAVDLLPTFVEVAGGKLPQGYASDGQSVLGLLKGGTVEREKPMFWEWKYGKKSGKRPMLAVREDAWKLFIFRDEKRFELYNVMQDRAETMNLADKHPEMVKRMTALALEWEATLPLGPSTAAVSKNRSKKSEKKKKSKKAKKK